MPSFYYSTRIQKMNFGRRSKVTSSCKWPIIWGGGCLFSLWRKPRSLWTASKTDSVQELPRTQTSLSRSKFARKERREGENRQKPSHGLLRFDNIDAHFELAFVRDVKNEAPGEEDGSGSIRSCKTTWTPAGNKKSVENNKNASLKLLVTKRKKHLVKKQP